MRQISKLFSNKKQLIRIIFRIKYNILIMRDINFRIKEIVDNYFEGNNSKFAKVVQTDEANIRNYIKGTEPKATFFEKIIENTEINIEWLLTGNGERFSNQEIITPKNSISFDDMPVDKKLNLIFSDNTKLKEQIVNLEFKMKVLSSISTKAFELLFENFDMESLDTEEIEKNIKSEFNSEQ